jgi:hypothetical protein
MWAFDVETSRWPSRWNISTQMFEPWGWDCAARRGICRPGADSAATAYDVGEVATAGWTVMGRLRKLEWACPWSKRRGPMEGLRVRSHRDDSGMHRGPCQCRLMAKCQRCIGALALNSKIGRTTDFFTSTQGYPLLQETPALQPVQLFVPGPEVGGTLET